MNHGRVLWRPSPQSVLLFAAVIESGELMRFGEGRRFHSEGKFELSVSERMANALDC